MIIVSVTEQGISGSVSVPVEIKALLFKENIADYNRDLHNAPAWQFIVLLDGEIEITTSLDEVKRFAGGDVIFAGDTKPAMDTKPKCCAVRPEIPVHYGLKTV